MKKIVRLSKLAGPVGPMTAREIQQTRDWIEADWESHDIDRDACLLITRLLETIKNGIK